MPPQKSDFEREMMILEGEIRRLEAEFNMYFAGRLPRPPWETRTRVTALVKKHDQGFIRNTADRFRFESLQNRFQKFIELVDRQMTNRELGRPTMGARRTQEPAPVSAQKPKAAAAPTPGPPVEPGGVRFSRDAQLSADSQPVRQLFEQLSQAKQQAGENPIPVDRLAAVVRAQVDKFAAEGKNVSFKIAVKDGKVSLTAKPED